MATVRFIFCVVIDIKLFGKYRKKIQNLCIKKKRGGDAGASPKRDFYY